MIRRRQFITLLGGAAVARPVAASAQSSLLPIVAILSGGDDRFLAFRNGIAQGGFHDGRNTSIEVHSVSGRYDRLPVIAQELVNRKVVTCPEIFGPSIS
jgi:putative ABC transport system substrate-binding protein